MTEQAAVRRAVIVEDSPLVADDLTAKLSDLGYEVCGVTASPVEAMRLIDRHHPDVVTLDINLREASEGLGVATVLRATAMFPIVFVTGSASENVIAELEEFGASAVVRKPYTRDELAAGIDRATSSGDAASDL